MAWNDITWSLSELILRNGQRAGTGIIPIILRMNEVLLLNTSNWSRNRTDIKHVQADVILSQFTIYFIKQSSLWHAKINFINWYKIEFLTYQQIVCAVLRGKWNMKQNEWHQSEPEGTKEMKEKGEMRWNYGRKRRIENWKQKDNE